MTDAAVELAVEIAKAVQSSSASKAERFDALVAVIKALGAP